MASYCYEQHLWDGVKQVTDRFNEGKRTLNQLQKFLEARAAIEADAARKLASLCAKPVASGSQKGPAEARTLGAGWEALKLNTDEQQKSKLAFATVLQKLATDLATLKREITRQKDTLLSNIKRINDDLEKGKAAVKKTKTTYHQKTESAENSLFAYEAAQQNPQVTPKALSKLLATSQRLKKDAETADHAYQAQLQEFQTFQIKYEESMKDYLKQFQQIEEQRVSKIQEALTTVSSSQDTALQEINQQHDTLKGVINKVKGLDDLQQFISENKTGLQPPKPTEYEPYKGKHENFKRTTIPQNLIPSSQKNSDAGSSPQPKKAAGPTTSMEPTRSTSGPNTSSNKLRAKALFEYNAADATELSFGVGDIIFVTKQDSSGWWEGENGGKHGMFPGNYVELISDTADTRKKCKVAFEFIASGSDELTIKVGEIVYIDIETEGWYSGTNDRGESGLFPANYVEII